MLMKTAKISFKSELFKKIPPIIDDKTKVTGLMKKNILSCFADFCFLSSKKIEIIKAEIIIIPQIIKYLGNKKIAPKPVKTAIGVKKTSNLYNKSIRE